MQITVEKCDYCGKLFENEKVYISHFNAHKQVELIQLLYSEPKLQRDKKMIKLICPCQVSEKEVEGIVWSDTLIEGIIYSKDSWHCHCEICGRTFRIQDITD